MNLATVDGSDLVDDLVIAVMSMAAGQSGEHQAAECKAEITRRLERLHELEATRPANAESLANARGGGAWTDAQCLEFASVAFRHAPKNLPDNVTIQDIRMGAARAIRLTSPPDSEVQS